MRRAACLLAAAFAAGCAAKKPLWIGRPNAVYDANRYISAAGSGGSAEEAADNARAEIAKMFRVRVEQTAHDRASETVDARGKRAFDNKTDVRTRVQTDGVLEGARIDETWFDRASGRHHAVALLDRTALAARAAMEASDAAERHEAAKRDADALQGADRARALSRALAALDDEAAAEARRRWASGTDAGAGLAAGGRSGERADLEARLRMELASISVTVAAEEPGLAAAIGAELRALGLSVENDGLWTLEPALAVSPSERGHPRWAFARYEARWRLADNAGRVIAQGAPSGEESGLSPAQAAARAHEAGRAALTAAIRNGLQLYLFDQGGVR